METVDVAIVGGGISGLAAAYELQTKNIRFHLLEAQPRLGGLILTDHIDGFTIDAGPDSLLVQKPEAISLCKELGLGDQLVTTLQPRTAYILRSGVLHPLPAASILGIPTRLFPLISNKLLSPAARLRMAMELTIPRRTHIDKDESIGSFFRRRFGAETVTYLAEPLLAGIHSGDVERLSMRALFPRFLDAERQHVSVLRAFRQRESATPKDGIFRSLSNGIAELVTSLVRTLPKDSISCNTCVNAIDAAKPYTLYSDSGRVIRANAIILAVPAYVTANLITSLDSELANLCKSINYTSTVAVVLSYPRTSIENPLLGTGFLVPRVEQNYTVTAVSWVSSKWPNRTPGGQVLLRAFIGGTRDPEALNRNDNELVRQTDTDLRKILQIKGRPELIRVYRWNRANPQHEVGHLDLLTAIEKKLERWPGLYLTGSGFRGVGISDCIADGRSTATAAAQAVTVP